jgi:hypothetical protein
MRQRHDQNLIIRIVVRQMFIRAFEKRKAQSGFLERHDIKTFVNYIDAMKKRI